MSKLQTTPSGWKLTTLGTFMEFKNGVNADKNAYGSGTEFVNVMDIFKRNFMKKCNILGKVEITEKQKAEYSVKYGDILFNRTSEVPDEIAFSSVYLDEAEITFGGFVIRGRQKKELLDPLFAGYCFNNSSIRREMIRRSQGVVRANIGQKDLNKVPILIPPKDEQKKIASVLALWDNAIEKTEALITAKEKQFEWLTSNLINRAGHKRTAASGLMTEISKRNKSSTIERVLSVTNHSGFVLPEEQFERRVASANVSNYKVVEQGQYAYNPSRINVGSIARLDDWENGILSPMYVVFKLDTKKVCSDYFLHWLNSSEARQRIKNSAQGSVRETVSFKDLGAIDIPLPAMDVQKDVTYKLNLAQKEISLLKKTLEQYRSQKSGLMQKLLTGEWQVSSTQLAAEGTLQELSKESVA
ncbi:restriction endonuclease subunit S [Proteus mirabilis]|uniref:restriction endonuclease subunit S n=1 Tax=Proteus mirabilis TaxID=584 RepID=UPI0025780E1D|nr:restriction endonuclease subunit S [Proteus mirabilis]MDM3823800.1 restriction endonuclease subunit S [Proteus mirabilis]MDX7295915.1 restriction endonuclease subunit S [Proteus mirabilis]HDY8205502.1 restriction endonuclease subunit S [Vibrio vulnificus]